MKGILLTALMTCSLVEGKGRDQAHPEIESEILRVEHQRDEAIQKRDIATLDKIQSDDLSFVNTRGVVLDKAQYMDEIQSGALKFLSFQQDDYRFHIFGDTVVMTGRSSGWVEYHGKVNKTPRRFTIVYVRRKGKWMFVSYQATLIPEQ
jgi:ketosteroid isomerase-like protein